MAYGEYITTVSDYENKTNTNQSLPPALKGQMPTALCKEKIRLKTFKRQMPQNPLEEVIFWNLSR
ncbi:MAG: hypothetical protein PHE78_00940 [Candidatus Gastranaerophilales bacterium]|jgi:hypothetical protein|nr:hypothetical protein [Candidatus Gastranaerophilales bacterium]